MAGTGGGFELTLNNVGKARFDLYHSHNTYTPVIGNTVLTTGAWHHIAGVWDGSYMRLYVNGVLDATTTTGNGPASGTSSVKLGRNSGGNYFNGLIDEVRVSNTAVYSSNFTPQTHLSATANTKGLWKFDGQVATDFSTTRNKSANPDPEDLEPDNGNIDSNNDDLLDDPEGDVKKLSPDEIEKLQDGGVDIHKLKGGKGASKYNLYKDVKGNIYVKRKGGGGEADPTGLNIKDYP